MRFIVIILFPFLLLTSCLKEIEGVHDLNTNIFDKDYVGDCWFNVTDVYSFVNLDGETKIRVEAILPESNMPGLKPLIVQMFCSVNNQPEIFLNVQTNNDGNYPFYYEAEPETSSQYCFEAGLYLQNEDTTINWFTVCTQL